MAPCCPEGLADCRGEGTVRWSLRTFPGLRREGGAGEGPARSRASVLHKFRVAGAERGGGNAGEAQEGQGICV